MPQKEQKWGFTVLDEAANERPLSQYLSEHWNLLVLLRHGECIECNMLMYELKNLLFHLREWKVQLILVAHQPPENLMRIRQRLNIDPEIMLLTDPSRTLHQELQLHHGFWQSFGPKALFNLIRGLFDGHIQTKFFDYRPQQSGLVLLDQQNQSRWIHRSRHLGDIPTAGQVLTEVLKLVSLQQPETIR